MQSDATGRLEVVKLDAAKVRTPAGNRKITPESLADILPSIEKEGQLVPGIVFPMPEHPGEYGCCDGNRRLLACRILGLTFLAYLLESVPTEEELIKLRVTLNHKRKDATPYELAADILRWIELKNANQKMASEFFLISEPQVSKLLNKARNATPAVMQAEKDGRIGEDVGRLLATLPKEQQVEALQHVIANDMKRDAVEKYVAVLNGGKRPRSAKPVSARDDGALFQFPANWTFERIVEFAKRLEETAKRAMKINGLTPAALPGLLKG